MYTASGRSVYPDAGSPTLEDIAQGLSRIVRFAGQTEHWYCVLAHTFVVTALVPEEYRIHALLHDAPESIVSDVPTTWKSSHASFFENVLLGRIYYEYGVPDIKKDFKAMDAVKRADRICLSIEADILGHSLRNHDDFRVAMSDEERSIAESLTREYLAIGPLDWISGRFVEKYVLDVKDELCAKV